MKSQFSLLSHFFRTATLTLAVLMLINSTACSPAKNNCDGVLCQNSGTCIAGVCDCPPGYLGLKCETKANAQFAGDYTGQMNCDGSPNTESIPIEGSVNPNAITIHLNSLQSLTATVNGNAITIPVQNFPSGSENYRYSGSGTLNGNNLSLTLYVLYSSNDPDISYICTFTGNK